jgi:hypothetical protein
VRLLLADNPSSKIFTKNYQERYKKKGIRSIKKILFKGIVWQDLKIQSLGGSVFIYGKNRQWAPQPTNLTKKEICDNLNTSSELHQSSFIIKNK